MARGHRGRETDLVHGSIRIGVLEDVSDHLLQRENACVARVGVHGMPIQQLLQRLGGGDQGFQIVAQGSFEARWGPCCLDVALTLAHVRAIHDAGISARKWKVNRGTWRERLEPPRVETPYLIGTTEVP